MRRTILYVHSSDELYGSDVVMLDLIRGLDSGAFRAVVALPNDLPYSGLLANRLTALGTDIYKLDLGVLRRRYLKARKAIGLGIRLVRATVQLRRLIRKEQVDLVHSNTFAVWAGGLAARLERRPHLWHLQELLTGSPLLRKTAGLVAVTLSDVLVADSQATSQSYLITERPKRRIRIIYNGIEMPQRAAESVRNRVRNDLHIADDEVLVATIGRVSARKGAREFILAAAEALDVNRRLRFLVAGAPVPGDEAFVEELRQIVAKRGIGGAVIFAGFRSDVQDLLDGIDILVMASLLPEPFGQSALEAMSHARPVIATRAGGVAELVAEGETGLLVAPGDFKGLAQAILRLALDSELRTRMGRAGRKRAETNFSLNGYREQIVGLYKSLLDSGHIGET